MTLGQSLGLQKVSPLAAGVDFDLGVSQIAVGISGEYGVNLGSVAGVTTTAGHPGLMIFMVVAILAAMYFLLFAQLFVPNIIKHPINDEKPACE